jgi:hypothetical protein
MKLTVERYVYVEAEDERGAIEKANACVWVDEDKHDSNLTDWESVSKAEECS